MAIELISKIKPANNGSFAMVDAADVEMPDGTRLSEFTGGGDSTGFVSYTERQVISLDERIIARENIGAADAEDTEARLAALEEGGGSAEIPIFDLAALGMTAIPLTGGNAALETDTTELFAALDKGAVTFGLPIVMDGVAITGWCTMHSFTDGATMHQCVGAFFNTEMLFLSVTVAEGYVQAALMPLSELLPAETPPATIDMSAYESEGKIVETYADGTSGTTLFEFDAEGNPTKITDSNGNVTVLTW